jgi:hypothetical protein
VGEICPNSSSQRGNPATNAWPSLGFLSFYLDVDGQA